MKEMVSVIIPVYKTEQYLDRCIESVVNQTYKNLEIILVDDGSPDNCPKMCDEWAKKDSRIKVIHKENGGLSDARNVGIDCATGEYLSFIDSDDFISNQMYEKMLNSIENFNADIAVCGIETFYDGQTPNVMVDKKDEVISNKEAFLRLNNKEYNTYLVIACNKLYKKELFAKLRYPLRKIHEDEFLIHHILGECSKIVCTYQKYYFYYMRQGSITKSGFNEKHLATIDAMEDRLEYVHSKFPELENEMKLLALKCYSALYCRAKNGKADNVVLKKIKYKYNQLYSETENKGLRFFVFRYFKNLYCIAFNLKNKRK